jgi:hypothetical protein
MTEAKWLSSGDPEPMLAYLGDTASARKLRYFLVACARRVLPQKPDRDMVEALDVAEHFADGNGTKADLARARKSLKEMHHARMTRWAPLYTSNIRSVPAWHAARDQIVRAAREGAGCCAWASTRTTSTSGFISMTYPDREMAAQAALLRDIFGNPFQPLSFDPAWRSATAAAIAQGMYDSRDFSAMPILADALQDAGCDSDDILDHCRGNAPHVRGCWVVDLVLEKQ